MRPAVLDSEEMRRLDAWAIEERGIPGLDLMETAGQALAGEIVHLRPRGPVRVLCGSGNNGGDGLVAARRLDGHGIEVEVLLLAEPDRLSFDAAENLARLEAPWRVVPAGELEASLQGSGAIVDAMLGTGFAGTPRDPVAGAIRAARSVPAPVVSADIASGVDASTGEVATDPEDAAWGLAMAADVTVAFHASKVGHHVAPGKRYSGRVAVAPIGIPSWDPEAPLQARCALIDGEVLGLAPRRGPASTKFSSGRVAVLGGSPGLTGAVCLAAEGAMRGGAGYATALVPAALSTVLEQKLTEVMSVGLPDSGGRLGPDAADEAIESMDAAAAAVVGSGLGREPGSLELARQACARARCPLVVDADGLNAFAGRAGELAGRTAPTVLTPHAGELGRLLGTASAEVEASRLESATELAQRAGAVTVLKGDDTIVTDGERVALNAEAAPSLATAGTGDVLAGLIAALIARGMEPFAAACAAVLGHARAGREAARGTGLAESVIASDVIAALPAGLRASGAAAAADRLPGSDG